MEKLDKIIEDAKRDMADMGCCWEETSKQLLAVAELINEMTRESNGVDNYHLTGRLATWDEVLSEI